MMLTKKFNKKNISKNVSKKKLNIEFNINCNDNRYKLTKNIDRILLNLPKNKEDWLNRKKFLKERTKLALGLFPFPHKCKLKYNYSFIEHNLIIMKNMEIAGLLSRAISNNFIKNAFIDLNLYRGDYSTINYTDINFLPGFIKYGGVKSLIELNYPNNLYLIKNKLSNELYKILSKNQK